VIWLSSLFKKMVSTCHASQTHAKA